MKKILTAAVALAALLALSACDDDHPGEHCVRSHTDLIPVVTMVNNVPITNLIPTETCDEWAPNDPATVKP